MSRRNKDTGFDRTFEGAEVLDALLAAAGSPHRTESVLEAMGEAHRDGDSANDLIPTLFDGEPRFADPSQARALFQNLLGLWDLVASGEKVTPSEKAPRPKKPVRPEVAPPQPFGAEGPDEAYVEGAWRYLESLGEKPLRRLMDTFENRQDALLEFLDQQPLSEEGYAASRYLLFELFAMLELGWKPGLRQVTAKALENSDPSLPDALHAMKAYMDEALFEAEQDEETPLPPADVETVRAAVERGLGALWAARKE